jgi:hypothetical protein
MLLSACVSSQTVKKAIDNVSLEDEETTALIKVKKKYDFNAYSEFLSRYPHSRYRDEILVLREKFRPAYRYQYKYRDDLSTFVKQGDVTRVKQLIDMGVQGSFPIRSGKPSEASKDRHNLSLMQQAIIAGNLKIIGLLLDSSFNINSQNPMGDTVLHLASFENRPEIIELLIARGADETIFNDLHLQYWELEKAKESEILFLKVATMIDSKKGYWKEGSNENELYYALNQQPKKLLQYVYIRTFLFSKALSRQIMPLSNYLGLAISQRRLDMYLKKNGQSRRGW